MLKNKTKFKESTEKLQKSQNLVFFLSDIRETNIIFQKTNC